MYELVLACLDTHPCKLWLSLEEECKNTSFLQQTYEHLTISRWQKKRITFLQLKITTANVCPLLPPIIFVLTKWTGSIWNFHVYNTKQRILNTIWRHIVDGWFYEQATFSDIFPPLQKYMN